MLVILPCLVALTFHDYFWMAVNAGYARQQSGKQVGHGLPIVWKDVFNREVLSLVPADIGHVGCYDKAYLDALLAKNADNFIRPSTILFLVASKRHNYV